MADGRMHASDGSDPTWVRWFAWGWVVLVVLAAAAEIFDLPGLGLAIDLQRHLY